MEVDFWGRYHTIYSFNTPIPILRRYVLMTVCCGPSQALYYRVEPTGLTGEPNGVAE